MGGDFTGTLGTSNDYSVPDWKMHDVIYRSEDYYLKTLSSDNLSAMSSEGWTAQVTVAGLTQNIDENTWASAFEVDTATHKWVLGFGTDNSYYPLLAERTGSTWTDIPLPGTVGPGFHTYAMTAAAGSNLVTVSVDGTPFLTGWSGTTGTYTGQMWFGNGTETAPTATYAYSGVSLTVPEPATITLLVTGMIGLLAYAWRKRK